MRIFIFGIATLAGAIGALPADAMSLREAAQHALQSDPRMQAADSAVQSSRAGLDEARSGYHPTVGVSASVAAQGLHLQSELPPGFTIPSVLNPASVSLRASQPLYTGGETTALVESSRQALAGSEEAEAATRQGLLLETATTYLDVARDRAIVGVQQANVDTLTQAVSDTQKRFNAGEATRTDVAQATARLAEARAGLRGAEAQRQSSEAAFKRVVGIVPDKLDENPPRPVLPKTQREALNAIEQIPEVLAADARARALRAQIDVARAARRPRLSLDGSAGEQNDSQLGLDSYNSWSVQLKASMPIYSGGAIDARIARAHADAEQAQAQAQDTRRAATERITQAWNALQAADEEVVAYQAAAEANALALENLHKELEVGTRTTLDLLDAERDKVAAEVNFAVSRGNRAAAAFQLLYACGRLRLEDMH
jgi:TolC family type I secretion outer membrane protein